MVVPSNTWETATMMPAMDITPMQAPHGQRRSPRRLVGRAILLGLVALVLAACGGADPDAASSAAPTVPVLEVVVTGDVAALVANVVDPDGELDLVTIEWGDGTSDTVTSGFPGVRLDHTYTEDGDFTIVLEARGASGQSVTATTVASITAFAAAAEAEAAATDDDRGSSSGSSGGSGGSGGGGTRPAPAPAPSPEPAPKEPEPEPVPEPKTLDLLDGGVGIDVSDRPPTGTGASAETEEREFGFGIRTYAWHGANGRGVAEGSVGRAVFAGSFLAAMPEHVTGVTAEVSYAVDAQAELKGPWDRSNEFEVRAVFGETSAAILVELSEGNDDENPIVRTPSGSHAGTLTTTLTRDDPEAFFAVRGRCTSTSGSHVFAYFNEGYCDALERGGIKLRALSVTFTPIIED